MSQLSPVLSYTPMLHSRLYHSTPSYPQQNFPAAQGTLDGHPSYDRPLIAQFCANDPAVFLASAKLIAPYVDAVDLNLGCPQGIARKGHYGSFLQDEWELIHNLISALHNSTNLSIPVTAKIRIFDDKQRTLDYARMVLSAGASFLAVHGRTRDQKGHNTGLADWETIRYLRTHLPPETVIFANGNVLWPGDADRCLTATGADGVMSAEGCLHNPTGIFLSPQSHPPEVLFPRVDKVAREYLDILRTLVLPYIDLHLQGTKVGIKTPVVEPNLTNVKSHLFKLFHALLPRYPEVRRSLSMAKPVHPRNEQAIDPLRDFVAVVDAVEGIIEQHLQNNPEDQFIAPSTPPSTMINRGDWWVPHGGWVGPKRKENDPHAWDVPWYRAQPYLRPLPEEAVRNGAMAASILRGGTAKPAVNGKGSEKGVFVHRDGDVSEDQERDVKRIKLGESVNGNGHILPADGGAAASSVVA